VTRERLAQTALVRFVRAPNGVIMADVAGKLPGRGVWITANRATLDEAMKAGAFKRGLKTDVEVPGDLPEQVEALLFQRCLGLLGMAKKAGNIVLGYDQVRAALRKERPGWLLEASDGAQDGRGKVYFLAKALYEDVNVAGALTSVELGMAFGRERVIHGLVRKVPIAKSFAVAYRRLTGFREAPESDWFSDTGSVAANRQTQDERSGPEYDM
jgi:predicted RNA-binding protein YlxR (DUF448 family)